MRFLALTKNHHCIHVLFERSVVGVKNSSLFFALILDHTRCVFVVVREGVRDLVAWSHYGVLQELR